MIMTNEDMAPLKDIEYGVHVNLIIIWAIQYSIYLRKDYDSLPNFPSNLSDTLQMCKKALQILTIHAAVTGSVQNSCATWGRYTR